MSKTTYTTKSIIEICQGYFDIYGSFNQDFNCNISRPYCCGRCTSKYCCSFNSFRLDQSTCIDKLRPTSFNLSFTSWILLLCIITIAIFLVSYKIYRKKKQSRQINVGNDENNYHGLAVLNTERTTTNSCNQYGSNFMANYPKLFHSQDDLPPSYDSLVKPNTNTINEEHEHDHEQKMTD